MDHELDPQKAHNQNYYQKESLMASSDPDMIKIHLQSSLCLNYDKFFSPPEEKGEQITQKGNKVLTTNITVEIQNQKVEGFITYSSYQQIFKFKVTTGHTEPQNPPILTN